MLFLGVVISSAEVVVAVINLDEDGMGVIGVLKCDMDALLSFRGVIGVLVECLGLLL